MFDSRFCVKRAPSSGDGGCGRPRRRDRDVESAARRPAVRRGGPSAGSRRPPTLVLLGLALLQLFLAPPARGEGSFSIRRIGYFDATAFAASGGEEGSADAGLSGGELDLILVSRFSSRLDLLVDLSLAGERLTASDSAPEDFDAALERAILRYDFRDSLKLSAGQFHTPISGWRDAYHRGRFLHVAASRPEMAEFDGRFLPAHLLGVMVEGTAYAGGWNPSYSFGLGDGRPAVTTADGAGDFRSDGAAVFAFSIEPARLRGLRFGVAVYADRLTPKAAGADVDESAVAAHLAWSRGINQIIGEYARIRHDLGGQSFESDAFYLEVTYQLRFFRQRMSLYNRVEELRIEAEEPVLRATSKRVSSLGVRFDQSDKTAFKAELRQESARGLRDAFELRLQTSLRF